MRFLRNMSISSRLGLGFGLLLLLLTVMTSVATVQMSRLANNAAYFSDKLVPSYETGFQIARELADIRRLEFRHVMANSEDGKAAAESRIMDARKAIEENLERYAKDQFADEEDTRRMTETRAAIDAYYATWDQLRTMSLELVADASKLSDVSMFVAGTSTAAYDSAQRAMQAWWDYNVQLAGDQTANAKAVYASARAIVLGMAGVSVIFGVLAAIWISRSVTRPIKQAVEVTRAVATGDLTREVKVTSSDETGQLLAALQEMTQQLSGIVGAVRSGSDSVATASSEIAQGHQDLSGRTEEQASALQQTAATMEQLGTTVRNNADSARQASQLAQAAAGVATQGGAVVGQVVTTMQGISDSSRRIGDIIGVIDGIAFQTNILALNAAVEAARAGEQGRGFAVVASEVRSLAQRSAEAAKEIKGLISRNVEQVEQGTSLVGRAGQTMEEIVSSIQRVSDIVTEISTASSEQSTGIQQVGESVGQMDRATQQNAALVEESAAAAETLKVQAQHLVQAVSVFRVAGDSAQARAG